MTEEQKYLIVLLAKKNMNVSEVVRGVYMSRRQVDLLLDKIERETKLDPRNFFDLHELYRMVSREVSEMDASPSIIKKRRRL